MTKLYKYLSPDILDFALQRDKYISLKCSYPKDYNDPYELFLAINPGEDPQLLAFYLDTVQQIDQKPTSCFSKRPDVTPMWAHYANNLTGFVVEFDEDKLKQHITDAIIDDVSYRDTPDPRISDSLHLAFGTCKPRHTMFFSQGVHYVAYFNKNTCWSYEMERRLVIEDSDIECQGDSMLVYVPVNCISSIIVGPRADKEKIEISKVVANEIGCKHYQMIIGKSSSTPYFINEKKQSFTYQENNIEKCISICKVCHEPIADMSIKCSWCSINSLHRKEAAGRNPMRAYASAGLLDDYIERFNKVGNKS
jgi:hypothetical protein